MMQLCECLAAAVSSAAGVKTYLDLLLCPGHAMIDDDVGIAMESQHNGAEAFPGLPTTEHQTGLSAWELHRRQSDRSRVSINLKMCFVRLTVGQSWSPHVDVI